MKCQSVLIFLENGAIKFFGLVSQGTLNLICDRLSVKFLIFLTLLKTTRGLLNRF